MRNAIVSNFHITVHSAGSLCIYLSFRHLINALVTKYYAIESVMFSSDASELELESSWTAVFPRANGTYESW